MIGPASRDGTAVPATDRLDAVAPLLFILLWSSSFIGARLGLRHMSPLLFVTLRMALAATILLGIMALRRRPRGQALGGLTPTAWFHCAVAGILTQAILLMTAHSAMVRTEAAPIALIQTLNPLFSSLLAWPLLGERLRLSQVAGLLLGFSGVLLVLGRAALSARAELGGLLATACGVGALCAGTLYYRRFCRFVPFWPSATVQALACVVFCGVSTCLFETPWADGDPVIIWAIGWNTVVVTIGGMGLYFFMLARGTAARATANFYPVPGVTALLTWLLLGERLVPATLLGLAVATLGCWLVGRRPGIPAIAT